MDFKFQNFSFSLDKSYMKGTLFISVSGAHSYGWSREDSDLDVRIAWFPDMSQALSIFFKTDTKDWKVKNEDDKMIEFVSYPIHCYLALLVKGDCNCLDNLFQHKLYEDKQKVEELQKLILANLHKGFLQHNLGYSHSLFKDTTLTTRIERYGLQKLILGRYRTLLQGLILEKHREIVFNLRKQSQYIKTKHMLDLLGDYKVELSNSTFNQQALEETNQLHEQLFEAIQKSNLPLQHQSGIEVILEQWYLQYYT